MKSIFFIFLCFYSGQRVTWPPRSVSNVCQHQCYFSVLPSSCLAGTDLLQKQLFRKSPASPAFGKTEHISNSFDWPSDTGMSSQEWCQEAGDCALCFVDEVRATPRSRDLLAQALWGLVGGTGNPAQGQVPKACAFLLKSFLLCLGKVN